MQHRRFSPVLRFGVVAFVFLLAVAALVTCLRLQGALTDAQAALEADAAALQNAEGRIAELEAAIPSPSLQETLVPDYTKLYPELYAEPWTGETVSSGKTVCLTFDDGPSENTDRVLEILDRYGVKATFFVVGQTGEADQQRLRDIVAAGHSLGIHSWSHDYAKIYASVEAYLEDFNQLYQWIYEVTGTRAQIFRFPGGSINGYNAGTYQEIIGEMTRRGFVYFDWNVSADDAIYDPPDATGIAENCLKGLGFDLAIVLAHDSVKRENTVEALPQVIQGYLDAGYSFCPLTPGVRPVIMGYPSPSI